MWVAKKSRRDRSGGAKCPNRGRRHMSAGVKEPEGDEQKVFLVIPIGTIYPRYYLELKVI